MYFNTKSYLKSTRNHTAEKLQKPNPLHGQLSIPDMYEGKIISLMH
jgi:hypothetical protein